MKPGDHRKITARLIELYCMHAPGPFSNHLEHHADDVIDGSREADTSPLTVRATNWHFYPANDQLKPIRTKLLGIMPITIYPTSDHILRRRIDELHKEIGKGISEDLFALVGRILHHIQDMSTPAHVVPVYHGLDVMDLVEDAINVTDSFEEYSEAHLEALLPTIIVDDARFRTLTEQPPTLAENYDQAAKATLQLLFGEGSGFSATVNGHAKQLGWDSYWQPWSPQLQDEASLHGFGRYGPLGHHFGATSVQVNDVRYEIPTKVCETFYRQQITKMLHDSIRALAYVQQAMKLE